MDESCFDSTLRYSNLTSGWLRILGIALAMPCPSSVSFLYEYSHQKPKHFHDQVLYFCPRLFELLYFRFLKVDDRISFLILT